MKKATSYLVGHVTEDLLQENKNLLGMQGEPYYSL